MDTSPSGSGAFYGKLANSTVALHMNSAIGDHFFQSAIGASSMNDVYFARPQFMFLDNYYSPQNNSWNGARCLSGPFISFTAPTIFDLLSSCSTPIPWAMYADGWSEDPAAGQCPPTYWQAAEFAESYYPSLTRNPVANWKDSSQFQIDVNQGTLPAVSHVRARPDRIEHPTKSNITASTNFINSIISAIDDSNTYNQNTIIFIVDDESGGYFDHISPPGLSAIDGQYYGGRVSFAAVGAAVKAPNGGGYVSHQVMEPSSLIKFIEWNWLNEQTGMLKGRDMICSNIGDFLTDPAVPKF